MKLLVSIKKKLGSNINILPDEELEGFNAPEYFSILTERARSLYFESSSFSISLLQERFDITFQTAARVMDQLEKEGLFEDDDEGEWEEMDWEEEI